jgi:hypothetical protein
MDHALEAAETQLALLGQPAPDVKTGASTGEMVPDVGGFIEALNGRLTYLECEVDQLKSVHPVGQRGLHLDGDGHVEPAPQAGEPLPTSCAACGRPYHANPRPLSAAQVEEVVQDVMLYMQEHSAISIAGRMSWLAGYLSHRARRGEQKTETPPIDYRAHAVGLTRAMRQFIDHHDARHGHCLHGCAAANATDALRDFGVEES